MLLGAQKKHNLTNESCMLCGSNHQPRSFLCVGGARSDNSVMCYDVWCSIVECSGAVS